MTDYLTVFDSAWVQSSPRSYHRHLLDTLAVSHVRAEIGGKQPQPGSNWSPKDGISHSGSFIIDIFSITSMLGRDCTARIAAELAIICSQCRT